jgi:rhodanese-related sulfurtransferase
LYQRRRERRRFALLTSSTASETAPSPHWRHIAPPLVLDARPEAPTHEAHRSIPGARTLDPHSPEQVDCALLAYDKVIYCICPDSTTAFDITQRMRRKGYTRIRALRGGLDAWQRRGFPVEPPVSPADELPPRKPALERYGDMGGAVTLRGLAPRRSASI